MTRLVLLLAALCLGTGCVASPRGAGEQCFGTSECDEGLTCDFGQSPPVCAEGQSGGPIDAATSDDASAADAATGPEADAAPGVPDAMPAPDAMPDAMPEPDAMPDPDAAPGDAGRA